MNNATFCNIQVYFSHIYYSYSYIYLFCIFQPIRKDRHFFLAPNHVKYFISHLIRQTISIQTVGFNGMLKFFFFVSCKMNELVTSHQ